MCRIGLASGSLAKCGTLDSIERQQSDQLENSQREESLVFQKTWFRLALVEGGVLNSGQLFALARARQGPLLDGGVDETINE